jgi:hypothetical protein
MFYAEIYDHQTMFRESGAEAGHMVGSEATLHVFARTMMMITSQQLFNLVFLLS